jgi:hypothetical protein
VFWVISVYFNIRNTLPKSDTFLLGHPVYIYIYIYIYINLLNFSIQWHSLGEASGAATPPLQSARGGKVGNKMNLMNENIEFSAPEHILNYQPKYCQRIYNKGL